ncbi:alpha/beta fold hydrolase [Aeromicrobium chenweiae]|uniref:Alpha/beta hydrolase n=1 Tax=Aeromicrobium chenweiae TaxID=2079793 RepID=A0A2S0WQV7_9ACTN|nr:alpha/beta hydrolase [Aeromicrobium chenweiae]AWB93729.1 alpha/beta hydrolase [Aeromicrobium chenweiae]TGN30422.1 alpha/beta hydrolase [Aeromicrobium chenweiae]
MPITPRFTKRKLVGLAAVSAVALGVAVPAASAAPSAPASKSTSAKPTVVLVHGAWADGSSFAPVTKLLQKHGYKVMNAPNPLRDLKTDAANVAAFVNQNTKGSVVLVGHSYGGSVITNAATKTPRVKALVYVNGYAPAKGESTYNLTGEKPGSLLANPHPETVFNFVQYPKGKGDVDTYVKPELFRKVFAARISNAKADVLAAAQQPLALSALKDTSGTPAWKKIKSFFLIGSHDKVLPPAQQLAMAKRAHGTVKRTGNDHLAMVEGPHTVATFIDKAARTK